MKSIDREIGRNNVMDGDKETFHNVSSPCGGWVGAYVLITRIQFADFVGYCPWTRSFLTVTWRIIHGPLWIGYF